MVLRYDLEEAEVDVKEFDARTVKQSRGGAKLVMLA